MNTDYRYPNEINILIGTVIIIIAATILFSTLSIGAFLLILVLGLAINYLFIRSQIEALKHNAVRVSEDQFPDIYELVKECAKKIGVPEDTSVYIQYNPYLNAFALGMGQPYSIVLYDSLVKALDPDELKSVIGHEMGHIHFQHTALLTLVGQLGNQTFGVPLIGDLIRFVFLFWARATELTADRAGLVACGSLRKSISTEVKLGVGPELAKKVDIIELIHQSDIENDNIFNTFGQMQSNHPLMNIRIKKMVDFFRSPRFKALRPDINIYQEIITLGLGVDQGKVEGIVCPSCQEITLDKKATFCAHCGNKFENKKCNVCQADLLSDWKVCPRCGNKVTA